ncbi:uncharacterized protein [Primulina eburnea]|uniref:uncharacterized protein isoform X2 n=1 Tax=Primulina eburnea TaxID=1245227 RepID=UPI003C6CB14A
MKSKKVAKKRKLSHTEVYTSIEPTDKGKQVTKNNELCLHEDEPSITLIAKRKNVAKNSKLSHFEEEPPIKPDGKRGFVTQCRPQGLYKLIQNFNDQQRDAVRSIGFGGLLHLSITSYPKKMLKWLIKNFNGASRMLKIDNNRSFVVTADDVHDVFLLPRSNGIDVLKLGRNEHLDLLVKLKDDYGIHARSPLSSLKDVIQTRLTDGGDDFKRFFILYSLCSFLNPSSNRLVSFGVVKSLVQVERISDYDWCTYVLKKLCNGVHKYNINPLQKNVNGCVLLLQILYFHKLKWHGIAERCTLPLIQHWTNERIRIRIKEESAAGEYGQGEWVIGTYPVSLNGKTTVEEKEHRSSVLVEEMNEIPLVSDGFNDSGSRFIKYKLPADKLDNFEIRKIAKDEVHETLLLLKRDISVVSDYHMMNLLKQMKTMEKKNVGSSQSHVLSDSQNFFSDPRVQKYVDEVVEKFEIVKKLTEGMPTFDLLTPDQGQVAEAENGNGVGEEETDNGFYNEGVGANSSDVGSDDFWLNNEEIGYLSKFINSNKNVLSGFDRQQKELVDYCLFVDDTLSKEEMLFRCGRICTVSKENILSLSPLNEIFFSVIDAWSLSINDEEAIEKKHKRFCFNLTQSLVYVDHDVDIAKIGMRSCWNDWLSQNSYDLSLVEMIFLPFRFNNHVAAVVINFREQKIQYLDNWKYDESENSFFQSAHIVYNEMVMFLKANNYVKGADGILKYEIENVAFNWKTKKRDVDSGVYLMHHMKYFEGVVYSSPNLFKADIRRGIRAEICTTIVLSEVNELRSDVLSKVFDFYKKKAEKMALKRDAAEIKKKKKQNILQHIGL